MEINCEGNKEGSKDEKTKTIFVGGLNYGIKEDNLELFFSECEKIKSIRSAKDQVENQKDHKV